MPGVVLVEGNPNASDALDEEVVVGRKEEGPACAGDLDIVIMRLIQSHPHTGTTSAIAFASQTKGRATTRLGEPTKLLLSGLRKIDQGSVL